jgi:hypothetical protein
MTSLCPAARSLQYVSIMQSNLEWLEFRGDGDKESEEQESNPLGALGEGGK